MTTDIRIRPMRPADAARVADLATQLGYPAEAAQIERRFAFLAARPVDTVLVATDDADVPIGWIHVARVASLEADDLALIGGLVIDDGQRSSGIGSALVGAAEDWARSQGARTMLVRSRSTRPRAHRFYQRIGFVQVKLSHVFEKPLG